MTPQQLQAMKLGLEALQSGDYWIGVEAVNAIHKALAQPEQEPVAWRNAAIRVGEDLSSVGPDGYYDMTAQQWLDWAIEQEPRGKNSLAQQEVCAKCKEWEAVCDQHLRHIKKLKKQRTWVGLTDEERIELLESTHPNNRWPLLALCEALLKDKNT